ncbi:proline--tRNA ligase [Herbidospora sp. NBRC 101105]|uniref:proline--tRNA ligase n=1 Tax=Herbidospora sp. NBRC 101105 TaxID=3032195 RepID=UPI0024A1FCEE|nr:proline--tRNA ligase [Herbidospora sp. NBRC 101105]GLX92146.1 proline--tRNA ligase [Herbidospora sp. NBRC 101105]
MLLRMSTLFLRTLREDPADAEVPSHKLLVRAGYVRRVAPGIYSWLPLGKIVLENVARVVREEMNAMGGQEVLFPALLPRDFYEATGRWTEYGDTLFRLKDRKGNDYLLGPTHEEMFTDMVKGEYSSYKDYPVTLYQIQTKYRDEARPRAGILRGREFVMKDSYSFDLDDEGLKRSYENHRAAYIRIFERLGIDVKICFATSGAMGGSASEEFLAPAPTGEDTFVACRTCGYAANAEAVTTPAPDPVAGEREALTVLDTPDTPTIETLVSYMNEHHGLKITAADTLKNVVVKVVTPGVKEAETLVIGVPGDREVDFKRLEAALAPGEPAIFEAGDFARHPGLVRGYIGPQILKELGIRYLVDPRVVDGSEWVTGANEPGKHAAHVVAGRDFIADGTIEAAEIRAGDACPVCGSDLSIDRGIEIGHIFQLGRKYADAAQLDALGPDGKPIRITMGSYGIGVSRAVAVMAEQRHDALGLAWPREVAPADVHIVGTGKENQIEIATKIAEELEAKGLRVLLDDRPQVSPGVKFKDSELLGLPTVLIVGRGVTNGVAELRDRATGDRAEIPLDEAVQKVLEACA